MTTHDEVGRVSEVTWSDAASAGANTKVLLHPVKAGAVVRLSGDARVMVTEFCERLGWTLSAKESNAAGGVTRPSRPETGYLRQEGSERRQFDRSVNRRFVGPVPRRGLPRANSQNGPAGYGAEQVQGGVGQVPSAARPR